ncbi:MAG TPA: DUF2807 domain-containing protein [Parabacteroides johnsonii]|nr:head GIN domain-containing protein [Parabacteroides johnsonii]MBV4242693.1 DUF2807 domain-containing protein [Parabacteroides johnsonii]UEA90237.1 DUF2807 domain-containing protein [Parabacteroides johnsonii]UWP42399.1 DUF2807 domain-containing protein [Parabacteroides johnsonii DSM 18315]HJG98431.1 DUF2807 domain-containing protein [Parabacteroides johnsonii]
MKLSLLALSCILIVMSGCSRIIKGDGKVEERSVPVEEYEELSIACPTGKIYYNQSEETSTLLVTTDLNIYDMLNIYVSGKTLVIKLKDTYKDKFIWPSEFTIHASSPKMKEIDLAGKAEVNLDGLFTAEKLDISVAGSGKINLNDSVLVDRLSTSIAGSSSIKGKALNVGTLHSEVAGSGRYELGGTAQKVSIEIAGKGTIKAYDLKARNVSCEVAGFGIFQVYASQSLNLEAAGLAKLSYKGNPSLSTEGIVMTRKAD